MIMRKNRALGGLLLKAGIRPAGEMEKDGKLISWDEINQLVILPFEDERGVAKYQIDESVADKILKKLDLVHWGCLIELDLKNRKVVDVEVIDDVLANFYENH